MFTVRRLHEECYVKGRKLFMCFVDFEKAFSWVLERVLEWVIMKKGMPEVWVRSVMSLYEGARTRVRVDSELLVEFQVKVWMHQVSVLYFFHL